MLKVENLVKTYGEKTVVNNLNIDLKAGQMLGLLGVNGAGKTTTFRMILNIINSDSGTITFDENEVSLKNTDKIGYLAEERSLLVKYKVLDQIRYFAKLKGMKKKDIEVEIDYWFEFFEMEQYRNKIVKELSKGNQQKLQFITAVIHKPKLIILDEPFSGLDPINIDLFKKAMTKLSNDGSAIIFSSHRMDHVEHFCEDVIIMYNGVPIISDKVTNLKENSEFKKVHVVADIDVKKVNEIIDVTNYEYLEEEHVFTISDVKTMDEIFKVAKTCNKLSKFVLIYPTLEEIFINAIKGEKDA